jgi:hypothetical protein
VFHSVVLYSITIVVSAEEVYHDASLSENVIVLFFKSLQAVHKLLDPRSSVSDGTNSA